MERLEIDTKWIFNGYQVDPIGLSSGFPATTDQNTWKVQNFVANLIFAIQNGAFEGLNLCEVFDNLG